MKRAAERDLQLLHQKLTEELMHREPVLSLRSLSMMDRQRQGLALTDVRYFTAILQNHLLDHTRSVVFTIEVTEDVYLLRFCCPVRPQKYQSLRSLDYVPPLRSKLYLQVGLDGAAPPYAWASVKLSPYSSVIDLYDALHVLARELEAFLRGEIMFCHLTKSQQ